MATQRVWYTAIMHLIFLFWFDCLSVECLDRITDWCLTFNPEVNSLYATNCYEALLHIVDGPQFVENYAIFQLRFTIQDNQLHPRIFELARALTVPNGICDKATMAPGPCAGIEG